MKYKISMRKQYVTHVMFNFMVNLLVRKMLQIWFFYRLKQQMKMTMKYPRHLEKIIRWKNSQKKTFLDAKINWQSSLLFENILIRKKKWLFCYPKILFQLI